MVPRLRLSIAKLRWHGNSKNKFQNRGALLDNSPTACVAASVGNLIGGAGDGQARRGGQARLLSPTAEVAASLRKVIGGANGKQEGGSRSKQDTKSQ